MRVYIEEVEHVLYRVFSRSPMGLKSDKGHGSHAGASNRTLTREFKIEILVVRGFSYQDWRLCYVNVLQTLYICIVELKLARHRLIVAYSSLRRIYVVLSPLCEITCASALITRVNYIQFKLYNI